MRTGTLTVLTLRMIPKIFFLGMSMKEENNLSQEFLSGLNIFKKKKKTMKGKETKYVNIEGTRSEQRQAPTCQRCQIVFVPCISVLIGFTFCL